MMQMRWIIYGLLWCMTALPLLAQQVQVERRTTSVLAYPQFRDVDIQFGFMRKGKAKANIFLKDASLVYMKDSTVMKADLGTVVSVNFGDTVYRKTGNQMGRVLAEKDGNYLVVVTTLNLKEYNDDSQRGNNLPFFELEGFNVFLEINGDFRDEAKGYPLKDEYYILYQGDPYRASEHIIKKLVRKDKRKDFTELMKDRFWSWRDAKSLERLLDLL